MQRKTALWQCLYEHVLPSRWQPSLARARALSPSTSGSLGGQPASPLTRMHIPTRLLQNESVSGKAQNLSHHVRACRGVPGCPRARGRAGSLTLLLQGPRRGQCLPAAGPRAAHRGLISFPDRFLATSLGESTLYGPALESRVGSAADPEDRWTRVSGMVESDLGL